MLQPKFHSPILLYLLLASIVGTRVCPCAVPTHGKAAGDDPVAARLAPPDRCCLSDQRPEAADGDSSPDDSPDPHEPCECQCKRIEIGAPRPSTRSWLPETPLDDPPVGPADRPFSRPVSGGSNRARPAHPGSPFVTADVILYVFHVLRC